MTKKALAITVGVAALTGVGGFALGIVTDQAVVRPRTHTIVRTPTDTAAVPAAEAAPVPVPPLPPKNSLISEALKRQQAAAGTTGELSWLKKRTGIDCGMLINENECLAMLTVIKDDDQVIARVGEFTAAGVSVLADKQPAAIQDRVAGSISDNGKTLYIYREASLEDIRTFLKR